MLTLARSQYGEDNFLREPFFESSVPRREPILFRCREAVKPICLANLLPGRDRDHSTHVAGAELGGCFPGAIEPNRGDLGRGYRAERSYRAELQAIHVDRRIRLRPRSVVTCLAAIAQEVRT